MANLVTSLIVAFWVSAIALLSVQNARPVTLRFLTLQSVQLPVGLVLSFSAAVGMVGTALILPARKVRAKPQDDDRFEEI
ncbi:MAG TPA: lipopolysaccharide assembly protein LapA domain-containing protein [Chroococcidiopsis sp.]